MHTATCPWRVVVALLLAVLAACGGGGGGGGGQGPAPLPPPGLPEPTPPTTPPSPPLPVPPSVPPTIPPAEAATYRVGPCPAGQSCSGQALADLAAAANTVKPGDVVHIYPAAQAYPPVRFTRAGTASKPIRFQGVTVNGQRPLIRGVANGQGYAVHFSGSHYTVLDNVDVSNGIDRLAGGTLDTADYAAHQCVRHEAHEITLSNSKVFACPNNGVFGTDEGSGSLTLDAVEITRSGCVPGAMACDDGKHPVYVATDAQAFPQAVVRIRNSWIHGNVAGEGVKLRARRGEIYNNWIEVTGPHESRALALYGYDEQPQASLLKPIHHDVVGNVLIVDSSSGAASGANSVVRVGSDFDAVDGNGNTFGRARFVNNTILVNGSFVAAKSTRPVFWFFGRPEGIMAFNNVVIAVGGDAVLLMKEEGDVGKLEWAASDKLPRVMLTHNAVPSKTRILRTRTGEVVPLGTTAPAGYDWSAFMSSDGALPALSALPPTSFTPLLPPSGSALRGTGTAQTNPERHPFEKDPTRTYAVPGALPLPTRAPASPSPAGLLVGLERAAGTAPTLGAYD